jgi:hypothetical protein
MEEFDPTSKDNVMPAGYTFAEAMEEAEYRASIGDPTPVEVDEGEEK